MKHKLDPAGPAEILAENARMRGDLLTVAHRLAHDLRTPLGGIITTAEIINEMHLEKKIPPEMFMTSIFDSTESMTRLIENMSFVLKASANPQPKKLLKMQEVVFRSLQRVETRMLEKETAVTEPPAWPEVHGVFSWLEIVWGNLLSNAVQHGKDRLELGWREKNGAFQFWVSDNGPGVPTEKQASLFQPFDKLHQPENMGGLGLAIVRRLIELQGGTCGYEPLAAGAHFYFTLPMENK